eukprot:Phypoly_transcript_10844.p1 GENE.Phypoly_transcript_10844~~Phypoly_transcript_10844.p1  ORF type:complete len:240 (+),score=32.58 Phypoly_transcript_10844:165-884(+)
MPPGGSEDTVPGSSQQASPACLQPAHIPSFVFAFQMIIAKEGLKGLFKGLVPNLVGVFPSRAIYFGVYNTTKAQLLQRMKESPLVHLLAAMSAGVAVSTATSPIWLVKTRMQLQTTDSGHVPYKNSWDCVKRVHAEEGFRGFYKGLGASYLGIAESSIQFVLYEKLKSIVLLKKRESGVLVPTLGNTEYMALAACAKLTAAVCTYPHEVLRTRMREQRAIIPGQSPKYTGLLQALRLYF